MVFLTIQHLHVVGSLIWTLELLLRIKSVH